MANQVEIPVRDIKAGDVYDYGAWTALEDAIHLHDSFAQVKVRYKDGGIGQREWDNPNHEIVVTRA